MNKKDILGTIKIGAIILGIAVVLVVGGMSDLAGQKRDNAKKQYCKDIGMYYDFMHGVCKPGRDLR